MIVVITTRGHGYTLRAIAGGRLGVPSPRPRMVTYEQMFRRWSVPRATYVFADLERLAPWELAVAADLYRAMKAAGLRCLNDPARAMARVEMLDTLHGAGINPFKAYRADEKPRPARFPVFVRSETDHVKASDRLYDTQGDLDRGLAELAANGVPLRGALVVEQAAEPYSTALWAKWGTWRMGDAMSVDHIAVDDTWLVKIGDHGKVTKEIAADEHEAVASNRFADALRPVFDLAGIEFGRADHAVVGGRVVVYEINTNPYIGKFVADGNPQRARTQIIARTRIAEALAGIDTEAGGRVRIEPSELRQPQRWWWPGFATPKRP